MAKFIKATIIFLLIAILGTILTWGASIYFSEAQQCSLGTWTSQEGPGREVLGEEECSIIPNEQVLYIGLGITYVLSVFGIYKYYKKADFIPQHKRDALYNNPKARKEKVNKERWSKIGFVVIALLGGVLLGVGNYYIMDNHYDLPMYDQFTEVTLDLQQFLDEKVFKLEAPRDIETYRPEWFDKQFVLSAEVNGQKVDQINVYPSKNDHSTVLFTVGDGQEVTLVGYDERTDQCLIESDPSTYGWLDCSWIDGLPEDMGSSYRLF